MEEVGELQDRLESRDFYTLMLRLTKWRVPLVSWTLAWIQM